jgi:hypothetical protein
VAFRLLTARTLVLVARLQALVALPPVLVALRLAAAVLAVPVPAALPER